MRVAAFVFTLALICCAVQAQTSSASSTSNEIALARSAAPEQISRDSTVYVFRGGEYVKAVTGKGHFTCLVQHDGDPRSQYPVCMDEEWTRCDLTAYLREVALRKQGMSDALIAAEIDKLLRTGALPRPQRSGIAYMMSSQMRGLFSDTNPAGRIQPHVMVYATGATNQQIGVSSVPDARRQRIPFVLNEGRPDAYILVPMPKYTDGSLFESR